MVEGMSGLRKLAKERSEAEAGAQKSSSDCSACGSPALVKARPRGEAVAGPRVFGAKGFSEGEFLLRLGGRSVGVAEVREVSSSACFVRGFLLPVNLWPEDEAAAGLRIFLAKVLSGADLFLSREGRAFAVVAVGLSCFARAGLWVGVFLFTDKGSPRKRERKRSR